MACSRSPQENQNGSLACASFSKLLRVAPCSLHTYGAQRTREGRQRSQGIRTRFREWELHIRHLNPISRTYGKPAANSKPHGPRSSPQSPLTRTVVPATCKWKHQKKQAHLRHELTKVIRYSEMCKQLLVYANYL